MVITEIRNQSINFNPFKAGKPIEKVVAINESQKEIWLSCMIGGEPASLAYNESVSLKMNGELSIYHLRNALSTVAQRHEALRSTVSANGEHFIIYQSVDCDVKHIQLQELKDTAKSEAMSSFLQSQMLMPFDLQTGPLFRAYVHQLSDTEFYFTIIIHHIICDGWSTGIILENLSKAYNANKNGSLLSLPPVIQLSDYAIQQHLFFQSNEFKKIENFWLELYSKEIPLMDLPTDFPRKKNRTYKAARIDHKLAANLVNKVKGTGSKAGCSLVNTMLSLFQVFLFQQTKQNDIIVGLPAAGQLATDNHELVGHCVNILPIRTQIDPSQSFLAYLKQSKSIFLDAYENQLFSFGQLLSKLKFKRDSSRIPLVPIVFNIDMGMSNAVTFDGLSSQLISNPRAYETFEIFLNATGSENNLVLEWTYNTQIFKETTINRMIAEFEELLHVFVENPNGSVDKACTTAIGVEIASSRGPIVNIENTFLDLFQLSCSKYAHKTALRFDNEFLLYKDLEEQANGLAVLLIKEGVKKGDIVAIITERSPQMLISLLAIMKTGAAYLPLDPQYPKDRIEFMLDDADAKTILVTRKYQETFITKGKKLVIEDIWPFLQKGALVSVDVTGKDLAYVLYTSGSTGKPKGVQISHRNLVNFLTSMQLEPGITANDRLLAITTISFDIAGLELYLPLVAGAELVLANTEATKDGRLLLAILKGQAISIMQATPSTYQMIIDAGWESPLPVKILCGGEALTKELAAKIFLLSKELWNMYGPTETTIWSTIKKCLPNEENITIGKAIQNTQVYVLDEENRPLTINEVGEICIGGDGVAQGYLNRTQLTNEKFLTHFGDNFANSKLYKTGDLGKILPNGEILCLGRIDQQVKIRGHRIELSEIETFIAQQVGIKQVVVTAQEVTLGDKRLVAFLTVDETISLVEHEQLNCNNNGENAKSVAKNIVAKWKENLKKYLPTYMVPDYFIALENFPLTPNGKIDRKSLTALTFANIINQNGAYLSANERIVAEIWSLVLGITDLKATDDFFELGGHSLLAIRVMVEIEKKVGLRLPLTVLFNNSTIGGMANYLTVNDKTNKWKSLIPIKTEGENPPLYIVHGKGMNIIGFRSLAPEFSSDQPIYGLQAKGLNPDDEPFEDVEAIATDYIKEMMDENPHGPYALIGYSSGGIIALEMSAQLEKMGKNISFLGLMDTYVDPDNYKDFLDRRDYRGMINFTFKSIGYAFSCLRNFPKTYLIHNKNFLLGTLYNTYKKFNLTTPDKTNPLYVVDRLQKAHDRAFKKYKLKKYRTPVHLFKANDKVNKYVRFGETNGFEPYIEGKIKVIKIPLGHLQFFEPPFVKTFASALKNALLNNTCKF